jgi:hypothetical protein
MNERIRELAVQAEKLADEATNAYNDDTGNWRKVWNEVYDEKFAELIVKECRNAISELDVDSPEATIALLMADGAIRSRFGVNK